MGDGLCFDDLDSFGRELDDEIDILEQDVVHLLLESFGSNVSARTRSVGLDDALSGTQDPALRHIVESKLQEDARIDQATATLTYLDGSLQIALRLSVSEKELGMTLRYDASGNVVRVDS